MTIPISAVGTRRIEPLSTDWRSIAFQGGRFDTGRRQLTPAVEGTICLPENLVLVTLSGGADNTEVSTDCGHRFEGRETSGAVSFVPAGCERRLRMRGVSARWASIAWTPPANRRNAIAPFTNIEDAFVLALVQECHRALDARQLDPAFCEAVLLALTRYMDRRYSAVRATPRGGLAPWRLRRLLDHIEDRLQEPILVADLAHLAGYSAGHLQRGFREATGKTPFAYIQERRVHRAIAILQAEPVSVAEAALRVGLQSPSKLALRMKQLTGRNPSEWRLAQPIERDG